METSILVVLTYLGDPIVSEVSFFTYCRQIQAEQSYLVQDAFPDFRHKAARVRLAPFSELSFSTAEGDSLMTVAEWWSNVQETVRQWRDDASATEIPDFEDTVSEYTSSQATTPTTSEHGGPVMLNVIG